ncbi:MAG: tripartite tricarboxylate transporter substrate binding protein [Proteobacteria bacterium]|nr:tripartite tricarboxylate transporter substrate binding protein [Pseudomonadota bacterium]
MRVLIALLLSPLLAFAQGYPTKPVKMIVPYAAGGTTDVLAHIMADKLTQGLGQTVVIEYKPGAGGTIGAEAAAKSPADGYTMVMGAPGSHSTATSLYAKLPYDPVKDFVPIVHVANVPNSIVVHPSLAVKSVPELIAYAKSRPGELTYGSAGTGATTHLTGELFALLANVKLTHIPYKGSGQAMVDLLGGQIQMMFENLPGAATQIRSGKIRGLAVTSLRRSAAFPDLPAVSETLPGFEVVAWFALFAPAGTPAAIVARLNAESNRALSLAEVREKIAAAGSDPIGGTSDELARFLASDIAKWTRVTREAGIKPQ